MNDMNRAPDKFGGLLQALAEAGPDGEPKYSRIEVEDVMAVAFMQSYRRVPLTSQDSDALMASFFARVGLESEADVDKLDVLIGDYFSHSPLQQDLLKVVVTALQGEQEPPRAVRAAYAIGSAF